MLEFLVLLQTVVWPSVACVALSCAVWCFEQWRHPSLQEQRLEQLAHCAAERAVELQKLADRVGKLEIAQGVGRK